MLQMDTEGDLTSYRWVRLVPLLAALRARARTILCTVVLLMALRASGDKLAIIYGECTVSLFGKCPHCAVGVSEIGVCALRSVP